jgi:hypothetical protein
MKLKFLVHIMALALLISACGAPAAIPTIDPLSVQSTAVAAASTYISQTQAAIPTITAIPASETPTSTPLPTETLDAALSTPTIILIPTDLPTFTPQPAAGNDPCNKALLTWQGPTATFTIVNETKPQGNIILLMSVVTKTGECGWLNIYSTTFSGPVGTYSAGAFVDGKKDFKVFGAFAIQEGGWKIVVRNDIITALGGCYPNC